MDSIDSVKLVKWRKLCQELIALAREYPPSSLLHYGANYAKAGLTMESREDIETQVLYILNNLKNYGNPRCKTLRAGFKEFL